MIASLFYRRPRLLVVVILLIFAAGGNAFFALPRLEDPVLKRRIGIVTTAFPGATVHQVDRLVSVPLSTAANDIVDVQQTRATSRAHVSTLLIELRDDVNDITSAWSRVREKLSRSAEDLPEESQRPQLEVLPIKACAAIVAIRPRDGHSAEATTLRPFALELESRLNALEGVESVDTYGGSQPGVAVEINVETLIETGLTLIDIADQIRRASSASQTDSVTLSDQNTSLAFPTEMTTTADLAKLNIRLPSGSIVPLGDLATIDQNLPETRDDLSLVDGTPAWVLGVNLEDGQRLDAWQPRFEQLLDQFNSELPASLQTETLFAQQPFVKARLIYLLQNFLFAAIAVLAVTFVMMGQRSSLVVATALPMSILLAMFGLHTLDISIQQISVTGLVIALGLLIDNAIVVVEEFRGRISAGTSTTVAMSETIRHLGLPLFASTLTTTVAFLPIAFLPGPSGEFVSSMAISVILAINASLLISLTLIPAIVAIWEQQRRFETQRPRGIESQKLTAAHRRLLNVALRWPLLAILCSLPVAVAGYLLLPQLPKQFFPPSDRNQLVVDLELPADTPLAETADYAGRVREQLVANPHVERLHWFVGRSAPTFYYNVIPSRRDSPNYAQGWADVSPDVDTKQLAAQLQQTLDEEFHNGRVLVRPLGQGPPVEAPIEIELLGPEWRVLQDLAWRLRRICNQTPGVLHSASPLDNTLPQVEFAIDGPAAGRLQIAPQTVANQLTSLVNGTEAGQLFAQEESLPIRVVIPQAERENIQQLLDIPLLGIEPRSPGPSVDDDENLPADRSLVPLSYLAEIKRNAAPGSLTRVDGRKSTVVNVQVETNRLPAAVQQDVEDELRATNFRVPAGYSASFRGETAARSGAVRDLTTHLAWLVGIAAGTLLLAFRSFRLVLIIAAVAGIAFSICPLVLAVSGLPLGFMAILGGMGLMGIAVNDAIVVVAALQAAAQNRNARIDAVVGCTRHILTTTFTTMAGFLPLIVWGGDFWRPLAMTISGGIALATLLSLYVVPSAYALLIPETTSD